MLSKKFVKYIQSLSDKKFRDHEGVFVAEGPKVVSEFLLTSNLPCRLLVAGEEWLSENESSIKNIAEKNIIAADEHWIKSISSLKTPNKVVAVFEKKPLRTEPVVKGKISLMLDEIQDPGNLGTIIRIADWFAVENILCSTNCADQYNSKVVQSTMGSLARVNLFYLDLADFLKRLDIPVFAATLDGTPVYKFNGVNEGIVLIGNESHGISEELLKVSSHRITIPRRGAAESLNAGVATAIILSHFLK